MNSYSQLNRQLTRGLILAVALVLAAAIVLPAHTALAQTPTATVTTGALNVRSGPSAGYPVVATVYQGDTVTLLGRSSNSTYFYLQTSAGVLGWSSSAHLSSNLPTSTLPVVADAEISAEILGTVSLRAGPGTEYDRIDVLQPGQVVGVLARNEGTSWVYIRLAVGKTGWVSSGFVNADASFLLLPIANAQGVPSSGSVFIGLSANGIAGVSNDFLRVGTGPRNETATVTFLDGNEKIEALARNEDGKWIYFLFHDDSLGWSETYKFDLKGDPMTLPVAVEGQVPTGEHLPASVLASVGVTTGTLPTAPIVSVTTVAPVAPAAPVVTTTSANATATQFLRVGAGPRNETATVTFLDQGVSVTLLGRSEDGKWVYIFFNGDSLGWAEAVHFSTTVNVMGLPLRHEGVDPVGEHLPASVIASVGGGGSVTVGGVTVTPGVPSPGAPTLVMGTGSVNAGALNVRAQPESWAAIINQIDNGVIVNLIARDSGAFWLYVGLPTGGYGWVDADFIDTPLNINTLPVTTAIIGSESFGLADITAEVLSVRAGDNTSYHRLGTVRKGEVVNLLGRNASSSWVVIRSLSGLQGWVASGEISSRIPLNVLPVFTAPVTDTYGTAQVVVAALNVRSGPSASTSSVAVVNKDVQMGILGRDASGAWIKVRLENGVVGWVSGGSVTMNVALNNLPVVG